MILSLERSFSDFKFRLTDSIIFSVVSKPISELNRISSILSNVISSITALPVMVSVIELTIFSRVLLKPSFNLPKLKFLNRLIFLFLYKFHCSINISNQ